MRCAATHRRAFTVLPEVMARKAPATGFAAALAGVEHSPFPGLPMPQWSACRIVAGLRRSLIDKVMSSALAAVAGRMV